MEGANIWDKNFVDNLGIVEAEVNHQCTPWLVLGWREPVTPNEIKTFLGVLLLMGIIYKPKSAGTGQRCIIFNSNVFWGDVLWPLWVDNEFFHFNDNSTYNPADENHDCLHKVQPLINT